MTAESFIKKDIKNRICVALYQSFGSQQNRNSGRSAASPSSSRNRVSLKKQTKKIYGEKWVMHTFHWQSAVWVSTDASCFRFTTKNFQPVGQDCILWSKIELFNSWLEVAQNGSLGQAHEFNRGTLRTWILLKQAAEYPASTKQVSIRDLQGSNELN